MDSEFKHITSTRSAIVYRKRKTIAQDKRTTARLSSERAIQPIVVLRFATHNNWQESHTKVSSRKLLTHFPKYTLVELSRAVILPISTSIQHTHPKASHHYISKQPFANPHT